MDNDDMTRDEYLKEEAKGTPAEVMPGRPVVVRESKLYELSTKSGALWSHRPMNEGSVRYAPSRSDAVVHIAVSEKHPQSV